MSTGSAKDNTAVAVTLGNTAIAEPEAATRPAAQASDPLDAMGWDVPVICKDCNERFEVPFRFFHAGVVFHCPHCHGSFVPTVEISRTVRERFAKFFAGIKQVREESKDDKREAQQVEAFKRELEKIATEMRPAGKMVKPKGLRAMFT
jgi:hypothetical protein